MSEYAELPHICGYTAIGRTSTLRRVQCFRPQQYAYQRYNYILPSY
jgi:hypothetical protein